MLQHSGALAVIKLHYWYANPHLALFTKPTQIVTAGLLQLMQLDRIFSHILKLFTCFHMLLHDFTTLIDFTHVGTIPHLQTSLLAVIMVSEPATTVSIRNPL